MLLVGGQQWTEVQLTKFVSAIDLAGYLGKIREKFIPNLVYFMTENPIAKFSFENEAELKKEMISLYVDEHMKGLSEYQKLTHDKRGAEFITAHFKPNKALKGDGVAQAKARDLDDKEWANVLGTILTYLDKPKDNMNEYMNDRPAGNLWIFRTMSRRSAKFIDENFDRMRTKARQVVPKILADDQEAEEILRDYFGSERNPDLEYALQGHFGDLFQALTYNNEVKDGNNVLVGFKIKEGAELVMFSPLVMILTGEHVDVRDYAIAKAMMNGKIFNGVNKGSGTDGIVKGYLSIKHEARGDFSFGLAKSEMSIVLFCLLVSDFIAYANGL